MILPMDPASGGRERMGGAYNGQPRPPTCGQGMEGRSVRRRETFTPSSAKREAPGRSRLTPPAPVLGRSRPGKCSRKDNALPDQRLALPYARLSCSFPLTFDSPLGYAVTVKKPLADNPESGYWLKIWGGEENGAICKQKSAKAGAKN